MTRLPPILTRALPLAAALALTTMAAEAAGPGNPSVFYCDEKSLVDRQAEIFAIRQDFLPGLKAVIDDPDGGDDRVQAAEEHAEYSARLKELELGVSSCKELRAFDRDRRRPPRPVVDDDGPLAPPPQPKPPPADADDGPLAPPPPSDDAEPAIIKDFLEVSTEIMEAEVARMRAEGASQEAIDDFVEASASAAIDEAARMREVLQEPAPVADVPPSATNDPLAPPSTTDPLAPPPGWKSPS